MSIDGDEDDSSEASPVGASEVNRVLGWLKKNNVDEAVLQVIDKIKIKDPDKQAPDDPIDPWRALQSTKDRLRNVSAQVQAAV